MIEERPKGKWEEICFYDEPSHYRCSECGKTNDAEEDECPYCHAKMETDWS